jgi:hypothetical protein
MERAIYSMVPQHPLLFYVNLNPVVRVITHSYILLKLREHDMSQLQPGNAKLSNGKYEHGHQDSRRLGECRLFPSRKVRLISRLGMKAPHTNLWSRARYTCIHTSRSTKPWPETPMRTGYSRSSLCTIITCDSTWMKPKIVH